ncbi:hypothetical protein H4R33_000944 [Dimargaris cristalligena]|nr:hypothetical protein H4R33_000944 [Dimargaris cristalligena]
MVSQKPQAIAKASTAPAKKQRQVKPAKPKAKPAVAAEEESDAESPSSELPPAPKNKGKKGKTFVTDTQVMLDMVSQITKKEDLKLKTRLLKQAKAPPKKSVQFA